MTCSPRRRVLVQQWFLALLVCALFVGGAAQGQHAHRSRAVPERSKIVEIDVADEDELRWLIDGLGANPLACVARPGAQQFHMTARQLAKLNAADKEYEVLVVDVEAAVAAERERIARSRTLRGGSWFDEYKNYAEVNAKIDEYVANYPGLVTKINIGATHEGRDIFAMRISGPGGPGAGDKPGVLFSGCMHAREWISPMTCMWIAEQLVTQYAVDSEIEAMVDGAEFFIVPIVNPDGYEYSWNEERLWRKNRRHNSGNIYGVDLNRNWDVDWNGGEGTSTSPSNYSYVGPAPFSEPETAALRDLFLAHPNIVAHIDYHSYGQVILQAWGYTNTLPAFYPAVHALGGRMQDAMLAVHGENYPHGSGDSLLYLASGTCSDWTHAQGAFGYTIELRPSGSPGFLLPEGEIIETGEENFAGAMEMAQWAIDTPSGNPCDLVPAYGTVNVFDLLALLLNWGNDGAGADLAEPANVVNVFDLLQLLLHWG